MKILVLNSGSSSIKYQLIDMDTRKPVSSGLVERIGQAEGVITHKYLRGGKMEKTQQTFAIPDHKTGLRRVAELLTDKQVGVISHPEEIRAVGHRMVHGGEYISDTCLITPDVENKIKELFPLAPLHNPPAYQGYEVARQVFPKAAQIAVFDTAFHQTMPPVAYRYAIPEELYTKHGIRKYGFHGTSHKYVSERAVEMLGGKEGSKIITVHLGNGCSMAAVKDGKCVDTSMGLGPLSGLVMGTRSGDVDPSVVFYMIQQLGYSLEDVVRILNKESGLKALCGSSDMRDVDAGMKAGKDDALFAYELYYYHIRQFIGAYAASMGGLDAVVFTAGIGENASYIRSGACRDLEFMGIDIDDAKNTAPSDQPREIQKDGAKVKVFVIPTNEELEIATQTYNLLLKQG